MALIGNIVMALSILFIFLGVVGIFRFREFYSRILITSKVDTMGFITLMAGVMLHSGFSFFSLKVLLLVVLVIITNPLSTHAIARSAHYSGYKIRKET